MYSPDISFVAAVLIWAILCFSVYGVLALVYPKKVPSGTSDTAIIFFILIAVIIAWFSSPPLVIGVHKLAGFDGAGEFGDSFGALSSLFSGLAFVGLIWTLIMQRRELALQRGELEKNRSEFERQRFESSLFSILNLFTMHIGTLEWGDGQQKLKGRDVLEYYASELPEQLSYVSIPDENGDWEDILADTGRNLDELVRDYVSLYELMFESDLGPYFRLLYSVMRHIDASSLDQDEKARYAKIVRAHLSSAELKILMFNCLSPMGEGFKTWVEVYALLKHTKMKDKDKNPLVVEAYHPNAFGN